MRYVLLYFKTMSTSEQTKQQIQQPKQFWEIYQINDFVDAKDNQGDWRVGYIVDKNTTTRFFKVRFDGWSQRYDEPFKFTSTKLRDFRTVVIGYTGQKKNPGIRNDWKFSLADHMNRISSMKEFLANIKQKTAREINQVLRGHNYLYSDFLMTRTFQTEETITSVIEYFKITIQMTVEYLKNIDQNFVQYYKGLQLNDDNYLICPQSAYIHSFYEILDTLNIVAGGYTRLSGFFHDNATLIRKFLNIDHEKNVKRYYQLYIIDEFLKIQGFEVFEVLLSKKLPRSECVIPFLFLKSLVSLYTGLSAQITKSDRQPYMKSFIQITKANINKLKDKDIKDLHKNHVAQLLESIRTLFSNTPEQKQIDEWTLQAEVKLCEKMIESPFFQKKLKGVVGLMEIFEKRKNLLDGELFVKELIKINMFELLFSSDNAEIIKKSVQLTKLLYQNDLLPHDKIYVIWAMRIGKHETALQQIYSFISSLPIKVKDEDFCIELFSQISKIPSQQWDEDYIQLVKEYSINGIGWVNGEKVKFKYGFDILYAYTLKKQNQFSFVTFHQILDRIEKTQLMAQFVASCFQKLGEGKDSYPHIVILLKIVQYKFHIFKEENIATSDIIIKDILRNVSDSPERVNQRFQLLSQLFKMLSINITFEQFMSLYDSFKNNKNYPIFLNWIVKKKEGNKLQINQRISSDIRKQIFDTIWPQNTNFASISNKQSQFFIEFFKSINIFQGKIKRGHQIFKVETLKLSGLSKVWQAFETVQSKVIVDSLAELITQIYMCPSKSMEEKKESWVNLLIAQLANKMREAYKVKNIGMLQKLLIIPKKIIDRDEEIFSQKSTKMIIPKEYTVINKATKQQKIIRFNLGWYCYEFKKIVSERFKIPLRKCKLTYKDQTIQYENYFKNMSQCSLHNAIFEVEEEDKPSVKQCINNELQLLFELLGDQKLQKLVWDIISKVPIAKQFMLKIQKSEKPWQEINNPSIYKELYMMRVMSFMEQSWWHLFIKGNGLSILAPKFNRVSVKSKIQREYLKVLCQAIDKCLLISDRNISVNADELILNIFSSLNFLVEILEKEEDKENKKNSIQLTIVTCSFKICEKLGNFTNPLSILLNKFPTPQLLIQRGLIKVKNDFLRRQFLIRLQGLNKFLTQVDSQIYLSLFFNNLFDVAIKFEFPEQTRQYFSFASYMVGQLKSGVVEKYLNEKNPNLLSELQHLLMSQKNQETVQSINYLLYGYLLLLKQLIKFSDPQIKKRLANFILYKCFFSLNNNEISQLKCKTKESRSAAFDLLRVILKVDSIINETIDFLSQMHKTARWRTRKLDDWTLTPGDKQKSSSGYVGLKNLGCTCYMNSLFQQMFMIPNFRQAILECDDPIYTKDSQIENVLFQIKKMFYNLTFSEQKYYIPIDFCYAFKDYEGNPTKMNEQMDIDEFSGILYDRLQNQMRGTNYENIIKDFFGGVFSNQIICKGCPHFSETEQSFLSVSLSVKNKKNIYQSFDAMIKGDTLDGDNRYFCERCNKKVSAVKRVCLKSLPDHLNLTLKRFQFDYETMTRNKINDYCQFPTELNVKQYSQQFLRKQQNPDRFDEDELYPDSYYEYVLKGVAIHLGYAQSGHYYSYIKERKNNEKWFQFNDTVVRPFDIKRLGQEAFGGEVGTFEVKEKIKNAYMLFYERKSKIKNPFPEKGRNSEKDSPIYSNMMGQITKMNMLQKIQNILFSEEYIKFATELIKQVPKLDHTSSQKVLKYIVLVYLTVTIREKQQLTAYNYLKKLNQVIIEQPKICDWVLQLFSSQTSLLQFFKNNPVKDRKKLLAYWLVQIAKYSSEKSKKLLIDNLLIYTTKSNQNISEFCLILFELMKIDSLRDYAFSKNIVGRFIQNIVKKVPAVFNSIENLQQVKSFSDEIGQQIVIEKTPFEQSRKNKLQTQNAYMWGILCMVFQKSEKEQIDLEDFLTESQVQYLHIPAIKIYKILEECKSKFQIKKLTKYLTHIAKNNENYSDQLITLIYKGLKEFQSKRYRQFFVLFKNLISIKDDYSEERLRKGFAKVVKALQDNQKYTLDCNIIQQWVVKIVRKSISLQKLLQKQLQILKYLKGLTGKKTPTEDICRKNTIFLQSTVNKYHGIKMFKSKKGYIDLAKENQQLYSDLAEKKPVQVNEWESDDDLTEQSIKVGDKIAFFDQKDSIDFMEAKVEDIFANRLTLSHEKSPKVLIWKDEQKLTTSLFKFTEEESSQDMLYSENTTEMDPQQQLDI